MRGMEHGTRGTAPATRDSRTEIKEGRSKQGYGLRGTAQGIGAGRFKIQEWRGPDEIGMNSLAATKPGRLRPSAPGGRLLRTHTHAANLSGLDLGKDLFQFRRQRHKELKLVARRHQHDDRYGKGWDILLIA